MTLPPPAHPPHLLSLTSTISHNLQHQHLWTSLTTHTSHFLPRPLISGVPPQRIYIHPDEQISLLKAAEEARKQKSGSSTEPAEIGAPEREWVLPTHLKEKWSLKKFGEVFEGIAQLEREELEEGGGEEREGKGEAARLLLATASDDSTVVYYVVHDGIVKPRQN